MTHFFLGGILSQRKESARVDDVRLCVCMREYRRHRREVAFAANDVAYAADVGEGDFMGLVARRPLRTGELVAAYSGEELPNDTDRTSEYLMSARDVRDLRRRVVIDGNPHGASHAVRNTNIAAFANFAPTGVANAGFVDRAPAVRHPLSSRPNSPHAWAQGTPHTCIQLVALRPIPKGVEIRADYNRGECPHFRQQILDQGIDAATLDSDAFLHLVWKSPRL
jgi:hypothetical protein